MCASFPGDPSVVCDELRPAGRSFGGVVVEKGCASVPFPANEDAVAAYSNGVRPSLQASRQEGVSSVPGWLASPPHLQWSQFTHQA